MIIKKAQVWKCTNFDAGLYDITSFLWVLIISIYHKFQDRKQDNNILYPFIYLELWFDQTWRPGKIELVK